MNNEESFHRKGNTADYLIFELVAQRAAARRTAIFSPMSPILSANKSESLEFLLSFNCNDPNCSESNPNLTKLDSYRKIVLF